MANKVKSLKKFFKESLIKKEVSKWDINDCVAYLQKHEKKSNKKIDITLDKKIRIVETHLLNKFKEWTFEDFIKYISKFDDKDLNEYLVKKTNHALKELVEKLKFEEVDEYLSSNNKIKINSVKKMLSDRMEEYLEEKSKNAPKCCLDPAGRTLGRRNTGVYLNEKGYEVEGFLGAGSGGIVWKCKKKGSNSSIAVKVPQQIEAYKEEKVALNKLEKMIEKSLKNNSVKDVYKYFNKVGENNRVFESQLASGDLSSHLSRKYKKGVTRKKGKTIDSILRKARKAVKAVYILHKAGYSHNDIKPLNLFIVSNESKLNKAMAEETKNETKGKKRSKTRIQLGDFGSMTKINDRETNANVAGTYWPSESEWKNTDPKIVAKRDVYALGLTFIMLLGFIEMYPTTLSNLRQKDIEEFYDEPYRSKRNYFENNFSGTSRKNMIAFLQLIKDMTKPSYSQVISIEEVRNRIKQLKSN